MARKKKKKRDRKPFFDDLSPHARQAIGAVLFVFIGIFFTLSLFGYAGLIGELTKKALVWLFGSIGAYLVLVVCLLYIYALFNPKEEDEKVSTSKIIGIVLFFFASLGLLELFNEAFGGLLGKALEAPLSYLIGNVASWTILVTALLVSIFLMFNTGLPKLSRKKQDVEEVEDEYDDLELPDENQEEYDEEGEENEDVPEEDEDEAPQKEKKSMGSRLGLSKNADFVVSHFQGPYDPPPIRLLQKDKGKANVGDVKANANIIKRTLQKFNIQVEMDEVTIGSSVTRYSLKPAEGVRLERIVSLQTNLEYALAASPIRIEAPIPGKSLVGIEVPNAQKQTVGLASVLASPEYTDSPKPLLVALGKDISGKAHFANVARMPHGLIAGTTGSGKSVMIHNLVISLLFRNSPEQLRFIMIDPKRVELTLYNGIPHLLTPVITDAKKSILSLKWAIKEMERRLDILQEEQVQNIASYHETIYNPAKEALLKKKQKDANEEDEELPEPLPYIVIIIDELADLMSAYPRELEASIVRLAQMSRAVGIHLILSTQRPSVNVITGTIKANIPTRLAFQVASQVDSRTILDQSGAEKLLGQGDMLFLSAEHPKPSRLQSSFVAEEEVKKVVNYLKKQSDLQELDSIDLDGNGNDSNPSAIFDSMVDDEEEDDLYEEVKEAVIANGSASTSWLQRKFRIGYSRAARLIDILEERGVIGPKDGAKPREVLAQDDTEEEYDEEEIDDEEEER